MHDMDDDECGDDCEVGGAPMTGWDFVLALFAFLAGVGEAFAGSMSYLSRSAAMANNHAAAQKQFEDETRAQLEALPVTEETSG